MKPLFIFVGVVIGLALLLAGIFGFVGVAMVVLGFASMIKGTSILFPISISTALLLAGWFVVDFSFYQAQK